MPVLNSAGIKGVNFRLSSFSLKLAAVIIMLIDHTAAILVSGPLYMPMRIIGRLAFPIFCFMIAEGFLHTHNRYKYLARLAVFAVISEIPFDLAFYGTLYYPGYQNVFITLSLGLLFLIIREKLIASGPVYKFFTAAALFIIIYAAELLHSDYAGAGILCIYFFILAHDHSRFRIPFYFAAVLTLCFSFSDLLSFNLLELFALPAIIPIVLYNGRRGLKTNKYAFYIFYPAHLLILYAASLLPSYF